jgi:protein-L-isoaspartate(D-aspartate) O-methyltransferase
MDLVEQLINQGWLKTARVIKAFQKIKRIDFLPDQFKKLADLDEPLPIGFSQTNSQPLTVAFMLELLDLKPADNVLDVGSGSGWTTSLLAEIVGLKGRVTALEINSQLKQFGDKNISKYNFIKKGIVQTFLTDANKGYSKNSLYDKILVSAAVVKVSDSLKSQLKIGGRMVIPIDSSIWLLVKKNEKEFQETEYPGFIFVPLV